MDNAERAELENWIEIIWNKAREMGLDPYPTHFELVPDHVVYELGSYGLPARFSHWTFGRDYHRQKTSYEYGMSKIYEIVFNTDPTQAFLLDSNSMLSHKLVVAHVFGHSDFFRRNTYFGHTDRKMIETVRLHARRIGEYERLYGPLVVEKFIDAVMSIEEHFDSTTPFYRHKSQEEYDRDRLQPGGRVTEFDDLWKMTETNSETEAPKPRKIPPEPDKDLMRFIRDYAPDLVEWQRDVVNILREEMLYFLPQMRTKIMNEGWASFWHERIMGELDLTSEEHWEFRRMHASVLSPGSRMSINPYYVGYQMLHDIKRRWDGERSADDTEEDWTGAAVSRPSGEGMKKIFEVVEDESDISFLRKYLSKKLVQDLDMYTYKQEEVDGEMLWVVQDTDWRKVRDSLVDSMTNFGAPVIMVEDGDYNRHRELYLMHNFDGKELDRDYTARTMKNLFFLWGRPVHLETMADGDPLLYTYNEDGLTEEPI